MIGQDAQKIAQALSGTGIEIKNCGKDFESAVRSCYEAAQPGDVVLLSPACASWDMFKNYAERSALFVEIGRTLAKEFEAQQKELAQRTPKSELTQEVAPSEDPEKSEAGRGL